MARTLGISRQSVRKYALEQQAKEQSAAALSGILRLVQSGHVTAEAMEYAATQALQFKKPRLGYIKACAEHSGSAGRLQLMAPPRADDDVFLHGLQAGGEA